MKRGQRIPVPPGEVCEQHSERTATYGIVGEVDSMGYESIYLCKDCAIEVEENLNAARNNVVHGQCENCKADGVPVHETRDPEEGQNGRVYNMCKPCIDQMQKDFTDDNAGDEDEIMYSPEDDEELDAQVDDDDVKYLSNGD